MTASPAPGGTVGRVTRAVRWRAGQLSRAGELERLRERLERSEHRRMLEQARAGRDVCWLEPEHEAEPLVTVRIATYRRGDLLMDRALASARRQSYERLEILVIGDATDDHTERLVRGTGDPRVRFVNLPHASLYPKPPARWFVAGSMPMNVGMLLARGSWLAPCDDDDELTDDHIASLLGHARSSRLEFVHSNTERQLSDGTWVVLGSPVLTAGQVTAGSVFYSLGLRFLPHSLSCWRMNEPQDWNLWRRMRELGVRIGHLDRVTYRYFWPSHDL